MWMVEQAYQDIYEDKYNDLQKASIEGDWDYYFANILIEKIENTLNEIKKYADEY